jgi:hypothetical protein
MGDDGIREVAGVRGSTDKGWTTIVVHEAYGDRISLNANCYERFMTPPQARHLAGRLYRLARRIEKRTEPAA